jgi:hypothetical protein
VEAQSPETEEGDRIEQLTEQVAELKDIIIAQSKGAVHQEETETRGPETRATQDSDPLEPRDAGLAAWQTPRAEESEAGGFSGEGAQVLDLESAGSIVPSKGTDPRAEVRETGGFSRDGDQVLDLESAGRIVPSQEIYGRDGGESVPEQSDYTYQWGPEVDQDGEDWRPESWLSGRSLQDIDEPDQNWWTDNEGGSARWLDDYPEWEENENDPGAESGKISQEMWEQGNEHPGSPNQSEPIREVGGHAAGIGPNGGPFYEDVQGEPPHSLDLPPRDPVEAESDPASSIPQGAGVPAGSSAALHASPPAVDSGDYNDLDLPLGPVGELRRDSEYQASPGVGRPDGPWVERPEDAAMATLRDSDNQYTPGTGKLDGQTEEIQESHSATVEADFPDFDLSPRDPGAVHTDSEYQIPGREGVEEGTSEGRPAESAIGRADYLHEDALGSLVAEVRRLGEKIGGMEEKLDDIAEETGTPLGAAVAEASSGDSEPVPLQGEDIASPAGSSLQQQLAASPQIPAPDPDLDTSGPVMEGVPAAGQEVSVSPAAQPEQGAKQSRGWRGASSTSAAPSGTDAGVSPAAPVEAVPEVESPVSAAAAGTAQGGESPAPGTTAEPSAPVASVPVVAEPPSSAAEAGAVQGGESPAPGPTEAPPAPAGTIPEATGPADTDIGTLNQSVRQLREMGKLFEALDRLKEG